MLAEERRTWNLFRVMRMDPSSRFTLSRRFSKATWGRRRRSRRSNQSQHWSVVLLLQVCYYIGRHLVFLEPEVTTFGREDAEKHWQIKCSYVERINAARGFCLTTSQPTLHVCFLLFDIFLDREHWTEDELNNGDVPAVMAAAIRGRCGYTTWSTGDKIFEYDGFLWEKVWPWRHRHLSEKFSDLQLEVLEAAAPERRPALNEDA